MGLKRAYERGVLEAGCDEAGRGCLAGPVFAAAVILPERIQLPYLNDSKQLTERVREELRPLIQRKALAWAVARVDPQEIDTINILWASVKAMHLALDQLTCRPACLLIDGNRFKPYPGIPHHCIIGGDGIYASIAAASVLAKTYRDDYMKALHEAHPQYAWNQNKGYGTLDHRNGIRKYGLSPHHRKSFRMGIELSGDLFAGPEDDREASEQNAAAL